MRASPLRMVAVAILGAGSWGTALAVHLGRLGRHVALWARSVNVEMPITEQMYMMLYEDKAPRQAVVELMTRSPRREVD